MRDNARTGNYHYVLIAHAKIRTAARNWPFLAWIQMFDLIDCAGWRCGGAARGAAGKLPARRGALGTGPSAPSI